MNHYPHSRWQPVIGVAAVVASAVTLAVTVVLPAKVTVEAAFNAPVIAKGETNPAAIPVSLGHIEVVARRPASVVKASNVTPTALETTKQSCPAQRHQA